jgi:Protein of unknown function (DUF3891)
MLFRQEAGRLLAIAQPAHAWIAGQLLRAWDEELPEPLLFAAEQHDIGWLDWEAAPTFNAATGRPHGFREVGPAAHAPMWRRGVEKSLASFGRHVALLVSRHGGLIYRRFARPAPGSADAEAVEAYFSEQGALEAQWMAALGLHEAETRRQSGLVAFVDALSLALCGDLQPPLDLEAPRCDESATRFRLTRDATGPYAFRLSPWPFRRATLTLEAEGWRMPDSGRFVDEAAFRAYFDRASWETFHAQLAAG